MAEISIKKETMENEEMKNTETKWGGLDDSSNSKIFENDKVKKGDVKPFNLWDNLKLKEEVDVKVKDFQIAGPSLKKETIENDEMKNIDVKPGKSDTKPMEEYKIKKTEEKPDESDDESDTESMEDDNKENESEEESCPEWYTLGFDENLDTEVEELQRILTIMYLETKGKMEFNELHSKIAYVLRTLTERYSEKKEMEEVLRIIFDDVQVLNFAIERIIKHNERRRSRRS